MSPPDAKRRPGPRAADTDSPPQQSGTDHGSRAIDRPPPAMTADPERCRHRQCLPGPRGGDLCMDCGAELGRPEPVKPTGREMLAAARRELAEARARATT